METFRQNLVDGGMLLRDLNEDGLKKELGIGAIHVGKIYREIKKLKEACFRLELSEMINHSIEKHGGLSDDNEIEELQQRLEEKTGIVEALQIELESLRNATDDGSGNYNKEGRSHHGGGGGANQGSGNSEELKQQAEEIEKLEDRLRELKEDKLHTVKNLAEQIQNLRY